MDQSPQQEELVSRGGCSKIGLLTFVVILAVMAALVVKAILIVREDSRLVHCRNNLKQMGLGILNYEQANKVFPPGTICAYDPIQPGNQYDVWSEAAETGPGYYGTSFIFRLSFYLECCCHGWNNNQGISSRDKGVKDRVCNFDIANMDIYIYCPSRREEFRPQDRQMMLSPAWTGGGTDYGGCAGRHAAFTLSTGYNICDASTYYEPSYFPPPMTADTDTAAKRWGVFGRVNAGTTFMEIRDGTSNTIMTGELQRILDLTPGSVDGWIIGGPATHFTTGAMFRRDGGRLRCVSSPAEGRLLNNGFFGSPGSNHARGANFGMADGSTKFIADNIDPAVFALIGSMADNENQAEKD